MAENDNGEESNKELRDKLEAALANLATANQTIDGMRADSAFAGLTVSDRQRKIILRELGEDKLDVTADNVKSVAKDLGFTTEPPPSPDTNANNQQQQQQQQNSGQGQQQDDNGDGAVNDDIMVSLNEMNVIDRAQWNARRGNLSPDLDTEMRNAKSPEELTQIIRTKGAASGLVHEWDTT